MNYLSIFVGARLLKSHSMRKADVWIVFFTVETELA